MRPKSVQTRTAKRERVTVASALRDAYLRFENDPKTKSFVLRVLAKPLNSART